MSEALIDIVAVSGHTGVSRWQALARRGSVAGVATMRPIILFRRGFLLPGAPAPRPGAADLSLYVEPAWRRRGIGSRLLAAVREQAVVPSLVIDVITGSPGEAFSLRNGFRRIRSSRHDLLTYGDVHGAWLGELVDVEHPGYRLVHWTGDPVGAPRAGELLRDPSRPGSAVLTAAETDGDLAAYVVAVVGAPSPRRARQYGPAVFAEHRGRPLGRWVNAALIQRLREIHPEVNEIETDTAENDLAMLAEREYLGFRPLRRTRLYELTLP
ncbi:GNAT family N-acetyltransferase [Actinoplanes subtropicus]|uniref:GNAT family N-acetyltransferase n=1 Tax=Actinoplanes subtropicus TaxID=543632 RepID=UPI00068D6076|nr:GNAT family N-acetyltransferase [Actinoplanes subtropicus]